MLHGGFYENFYENERENSKLFKLFPRKSRNFFEIVFVNTVYINLNKKASTF